MKQDQVFTDLEATLKQRSTGKQQKTINSTERNYSILFIGILRPNFYQFLHNKQQRCKPNHKQKRTCNIKCWKHYN